MHEMYKGLLVESESEIMIIDWLFELKEKGLIHSIERSPELIISRGLDNRYVKHTQMKTKVKEESKNQVILPPHHYTPEFTVQWYNRTPKALAWPISDIGIRKLEGALFGHSFPIVIDPSINNPLHQNGLITYIEVKPSFDYQNMSRLFRVNQQWVWESRKMYINLLEPISLYKATFTPVNYLKTRKTKTEREIKWKIITCDEYLNSIGYETQAQTL